MTGYRFSPAQALARDLLTLAVTGGTTHWARVDRCTLHCAPEQVRAEGIRLADRSGWAVDLHDVEQAISKLITSPAACAAPDGGIDEAVLHAAGLVLHATLVARRHGLALSADAQLDERISDIVFQVAIAHRITC